MRTLLCLFYLVLVSVASAEDAYKRFLVTISTSTVVSTTTSTTTTTPTTYCVTNSIPVTVCRKRRGIAEEPAPAGTGADSINPTGTLAIEPSRPAVMMPVGMSAAPAVQSSQKDTVEVRISGLNNACQARADLTTNWDPLLSITVVSTSSSTTTITATSTAATSTKTINMNCTPAGFMYTTC